MTREHYFKTILRTGLPSVVAGLAAFGAMTLVRGELAAQVGLLPGARPDVRWDRHRRPRAPQAVPRTVEEKARPEKACSSLGRDRIATHSSRDPICIRADDADTPSILVDERVRGVVVVNLDHTEVG
jgi:hypothetical protein